MMTMSLLEMLASNSGALQEANLKAADLFLAFEGPVGEDALT